MKIFILHPGKANYPEISAYRDYFQGRAEVFDGTTEDYKSLHDKGEIILWCIMGYYPKPLKSKYTIHDYRSLSVGRLSKIKDKIKRLNNSTPHLRIYQNSLIADAMNFKDNIPSIYLPMGVPDWIHTFESDKSLPQATFCYIGEITKERGMDTVINSFTRNKRPSDSFVIVGNPEKSIYEKYKNGKGLIFTGKIPQKDALSIVINSDYCICKIPKKYPFDIQMPTKFLEYAALNKPIICNDSPSNRLAIDYLNYPSIIVEDAIFTEKTFHEITNWQADTALEKDIRWSNVIKSSGIDGFISAAIEENL